MDPLFVLIIVVVLTLLISATCSLMEAALYAVPLPHVRLLAEQELRSGKKLLEFKEDIGRPIAAILILNTISNTGGASIAGWAGAQVFSQSGVVGFSILFVLCILFFSEIFPKTIGVQYARPVSQFVALPLGALVRVMGPLIDLSQFLSRKFGGDSVQPAISEEEVRSMANLGLEEGVLEDLEGSIITNVLGLDQLFVKDVLTPRVVVFRVPEARTLGEVRRDIEEWNFTRVPLFAEENQDDLKTYVIQRDVLRELMKGNDEKTLGSLGRPLTTVPELMRVDKLLLQMFENREHLCAVVDEHGGLAGIITLEDIIEEIVGQEIVDEYDTVSDLRTFARLLRYVRNKKR